MTTPGTTTLQIVKNGGAPASGVVVAAFSDSIVLKLADSSWVKKVRYRIWEYPDGFACPAGWTDSGKLYYYFDAANGANAPAFALPNGPNPDLWGNYMFDAVTNDRLRNGVVDNDLYDNKTCLYIPSLTGVRDISFGESNQFDQFRQYAAAIKGALRKFDAAVFSPGGVTDHGALSGLADVADHVWAELAQRPLSSYTAASNDAVLTDARACAITTRATAITLRIRLQASIAWPAETLLFGINAGAGTLTLTAEGGVTLNGSLTVPQNGWWWAKRTAANTWQIFTGGTAGSGGDLKADGTVPMAADFNLNTHKAVGMSAGSASTDGANKGQLDALEALGTKKDGSVAFTGNQSMGSHKLTALQDGATGTQEATSVAQVEALIAGSLSTIFDIKPSVRLATAAAMAASTRVSNVRTANANGAMATIDGVAPALNDRILDKDNAAPADRGLWVVTSLGSGGAPWVLTRTADADTNAEVTPGLACIPEEGTNKGHIFILTTAAPFVVNTSSWAFSDVQAVAGDGTTIQLSAGVLSVVAGIFIKPNGTVAFSADQSLGGKRLTSVGGESFSNTGGTANLGATPTINWGATAYQSGTLNANCAPTFTAPGLSNIALRLELIGDGTARTFTQPGGVIILGAAPLILSGVGAVTFLDYWYDGTSYFLIGDIASQLGPRGAENVAVDLFPSTSTQGTVNTGGSVTSDVPIATGRDYVITCKVVVVDGSAGILFAKTLNVWAQNIGGTVSKVAPDTVGFDNLGAGFTLTAANNSTNMRFTLANTSGTNRSYTLHIGYVATDKP